MRRVAGRLGQRRAVDHDVLAAHDRERVAGIGQVGLDVVRAGVAALVDRRREVAARDVVAGLDQLIDRCRAHLAVGARDEDPHPRAVYHLRATCSP